jgi:hypothetical protein
MTNRGALEAEIKALCGEMVGTLRTVSESAAPMTKARVRAALLEVEHNLKSACQLVDRLP